MRWLASQAFDAESIDVAWYGNVLTTVAFLYGLSCDDLREEEFEAHDPFFPTVVSLRAVKGFGVRA